MIQGKDQPSSILLINPAPSANWVYVDANLNIGPPMGLWSIGTFLVEAGYEVFLLDGAVDKDYKQHLRELLKNHFIFAGISVMTPQIPTALEIAGMIRSQSPGLPIVWGGVHVTLFAKQTVESGYADIGVVGLGESTSLELARSLSLKLPLADIRGIVYREGDKIIATPPREFPGSMDDFPLPNYRLLDLGQYLDKDYSLIGGGNVRSMKMQTGIGCPYRCAFCINKIAYRGQYRFKSAPRILEEIEYLLKEYSVTHIDFRDEDFFANKKRLLEFLAGINDRKLRFTWNANVRANYFSESFLTDELVARIRQSGCIALSMGAESGSQRILDKILKGIRLEQVKHSALVTKKHGIYMAYSFMMGIPGETKEEVYQTLDLALWLSSVSKDHYIIGPQVFRPYPGSELYQECLGLGLQEPATLAEWAKNYAQAEGYLSVDSLPWLSNKRLYKLIAFYSLYAFLQPGRSVKYYKRMILFILKQLSIFRLRHKFFGLAGEYELLKSLGKV